MLYYESYDVITNGAVSNSIRAVRRMTDNIISAKMKKQKLSIFFYKQLLTYYPYKDKLISKDCKLRQ